MDDTSTTNHKKGERRSRRLNRGLTALLALALAPHSISLLAGSAKAQTKPGWQADVEVKKTAPGSKSKPAKPPASNLTVIERTGADGSTSQLKLVALLTTDGQQIDQGVIWRVYQAGADLGGKAKLVAENREASPALRLLPGNYTVNAAFGRANLTRKISLKAGSTATEQFVLNAGGLRVSASVTGKPVPQGSVTYAIFSDDRDQFSNRTAVMSGAKPGLIIRLNAGIYHIVSTYGDANARVEADVTVEAGKLTEATVAHQAAKAAFKLVMHTGGEALPDTHWLVQSPGGELVKESVGALPNHTFAPGSYQVVAKSGGRTYLRKFSLKDGEVANIEVLADGSGEAAPAAESAQPSLEIKNP